MDIKGKVFIVTGGASGLGEGTARMLAENGATVVIADMQTEKGEAVAKEIGGVFCKVDIMSEDSVLAGFEAARAAHGQERVVVHDFLADLRSRSSLLAICQRLFYGIPISRTTVLRKRPSMSSPSSRPGCTRRS